MSMRTRRVTVLWKPLLKKSGKLSWDRSVADV